MESSERDLIIIGAGINGLAAGLAYALNTRDSGKRVLVLEKNPAAGGYVTSFSRKGFTFDTCQMASNISGILDYLGVKVDVHEFKDDCIRVFRADIATGNVRRSTLIILGIVEKYLVPYLREHIVVKDISTPATFARYSGSPSGSIHDMASVPANFGANRLPVRTPVKGLLVPKFAHGLFGAMNGGLQAADALLCGRVMHGNSRFR